MWNFPGGLVVKKSTCQYSSIPGWGRSLEKEMATTPVFLPGKSHGQRSLVGYSPWDHKKIGHDLVIKQQ